MKGFPITKKHTKLYKLVLRKNVAFAASYIEEEVPT